MTQSRVSSCFIQSSDKAAVTRWSQRAEEEVKGIMSCFLSLQDELMFLQYLCPIDSDAHKIFKEQYTKGQKKIKDKLKQIGDEVCQLEKELK